MFNKRNVKHSHKGIQNAIWENYCRELFDKMSNQKFNFFEYWYLEDSVFRIMNDGKLCTCSQKIELTINCDNIVGSYVGIFYLFIYLFIYLKTISN